MNQRRLRVLRIITRLNVGGPTRHVRLLMSGLPEDRCEQILVHGPCAPEEGEGVLSVSGERRLVEPLIRPISPKNDLLALKRLSGLMRALKPDLVHTHQGKAGLLGRIAAHRAGVGAIVHTYHGHTFTGYHGPLMGRALLAAERFAARRSHRLLCQSELQEKDVLAALGPPARGKTLLMPPAVDLAALTGGDDAAAFRRQQGVGEEQPVILVPARLVSIKQPQLAIDLVAQMKGPAAVLWFLGEGPLLPALQERARALGLADRVAFFPHTPHPAPWYRAADLTLLTSRNEGTPLVLLEAMATGCPVASTAVGGVPDLLREHGTLLAPEGSMADWAEAIEAQVSTRKRLSNAMRDEVRERFGADRLTRKMMELYTQLRVEQG